MAVLQKTDHGFARTIGAMMAPTDQVMPQPESGKLKFGKLATADFLVPV
jgi:hypothetical protein